MLANIFPLILSITFILSLIDSTVGVKCYQCSSNEDPKGQDNCGAYRKFDTYEHIATECNSEDSHMPGSFCMKTVQQSPKGYIWDGRWRQIIRRCASVSESGVTGVCNWGVYENGIYWEECYCAEDRCNSSNVIKSSILSAICTLLVVFKLF